MATGKKKIVVYADWKASFDALTNEEAGLLIKHFFAYVNDENPVSENRIVQLMFEPIKATLKRDLESWETTRTQRIQAGSKGGKQKVANAKKIKQKVANVAVIDSVSVSVSDNVNDISFKKETKYSFKNELLKLNFDEVLVEEWLSIRKAKKARNTETALKAFIREIQKSNLNHNEVLRICVERSWSGFDATWITNIKQNNNANRKQPISNAERKQSYIDRILFGNNESVDSKRSPNGEDNSAFDAVEFVES